MEYHSIRLGQLIWRGAFINSSSSTLIKKYGDMARSDEDNGNRIRFLENSYVGENILYSVDSDVSVFNSTLQDSDLTNYSHTLVPSRWHIWSDTVEKRFAVVDLRCKISLDNLSADEFTFNETVDLWQYGEYKLRDALSNAKQSFIDDEVVQYNVLMYGILRWILFAQEYYNLVATPKFPTEWTKVVPPRGPLAVATYDTPARNIVITKPNKAE